MIEGNPRLLILWKQYGWLFPKKIPTEIIGKRNIPKKVFVSRDCGRERLIDGRLKRKRYVLVR
jgi:hypothetical protein